MLHPIKDRCRRNIRHLFPRISCLDKRMHPFVPSSGSQPVYKESCCIRTFDDAADERQVPESLKTQRQVMIHAGWEKKFTL